MYFKRQRDSLHELLTLTLLPTVAVSRVTYLKYLHQAKEIRQKTSNGLGAPSCRLQLSNQFAGANLSGTVEEQENYLFYN